MEFFYHIKATQKSGKPDGVIWFSANTASRAALQLDVALEDVGIETGRGKDYAKPVRTDMPVVDDLPEEGVIDYTWCKCYELAEDQRTWNVIAGTAQQPHPDEKVVEGTDTTIVDSVDIETGESIVDADGTETVCDAVREFRERKLPVLTTVATLPFRQRLLAQYIADKQYFYHVDEEQKKAILELELDVDNSYVQNLILAAENVDGFKKAHEPDIWKVVNALKTIFPVDGKRINIVQRTDAGTNADGGYVTDRGEGAHHTLETLDLEIASALLPMDFNYREIPGSIARRAKEIIANKEEPWKSWSKILRNQPGVLAVNRAAIFNLVRIAPENIHLNPVAHLEFVNQTMTAEFNAATELLPLPAAQPEETQTAEEHPLPKWAEAGEQKLADEDEAETQTLPKWASTTASQPQVANLGGGMFAIEGLMNEKQPKNDDRSPVNEETTSDVQMEETNPAEGENSDAVSPDEGADAAAAQTDAVAGTICTGCGTEGGGGCPDCGAVAGDATYAVMEAGLKEELEALGEDTSKSETMFTHLMVDLETMGKKPGAPIVSVGAVFFDPASGKTGAEYYQVISLESSMSFGARPDASTILWWLKQSPEARSAIVLDDTVGLVEALEQFLDFIADNAANGSKNVQLWGNGSSFDCSLLESAFELADTPFPIPHWNYRDVRTVVELGKVVGLNSRYDIPFEGDQHNALADARHQVKYVSAIWQRLIAI